MSEIELLYKNAGVELYQCIYPRYCEAFMNNKCNYDCDFSKSRFTAEKQLSLIKWMIKTNHRYFIQDVFECEFEESLAKVLNLYWQDLTESEQEQIKRILEEWKL